MTILYTKRILPTNSDSNENAYMRIPGIVQNNMIDIEGNLTAPSLSSPKPSTAPDSNNHEIRLTLENPTINPIIDSNQSTQSIYYLPSLCFSFHNIVTNKLTFMLPNDQTIDLMQGHDSNSTNKIYYESFHYNNQIYTLNLENDGILASCYEFCFNNTYVDSLGYNKYAFVIGTYINQKMTDEEMFPNLYSSTSLLNNISSTREFEVGHNSILFTNVSLLFHGKLKKYEAGVSPYINPLYFEGIPNIFTDLYWVGVTLFYTNSNNEVCSSLNASSINIRPTVGSQFENSFKPYFGKKTKTLQTIPSEYKGSQRTQFGVQRGCPTSTNTSYGYTDVFGNVYIGDGTVAIKVSNEDKDFIKISQSVSLNDVIDQNIHVFIILLPC